jgi:hypothetical protein
MTQNSPLTDYDLMDCIEEGLNKFGPGIKYTVMWRMVVMGDSPKDGILANPQGFINALQSIFGHSAKLIEQEVVDRIKAHVGPEYTNINDLAYLVNALRRENSIFETISAK